VRRGFNHLFVEPDARARSAREEAAKVRCGIELLGAAKRPSLADYVRGSAATRGAIAARAC